MAKKQDINSLIEAQDKELKSRSLANLQNKLAENNEDTSQPNQNVLVKKAFWQKRNIAIISVLFLIVLLSILIPLLLHKNNPVDEFRYCSESDYYVEDSEQSIGQYASANEKNILYFDTETKFELLLSQQYKLNTTNEIICLNEELIGEDYIFSLCVTDNLTELDFSRNYAEICSLKKQMKSTEIYYGADTVNSYAKLEYDGYIYYLKVFDNSSEDYILGLVSELLGV